MVRRFAQHEVVLADELVVVQHVQLFAGAELLPTDAAREAVEVEDFVARFPHQVRRCDAVAAAAAFGAVSPVIPNQTSVVRLVWGMWRLLTERNRSDSTVSPRD